MLLQVVLEGQKVLPSRAQQQGFRFKYTELSDALRNILKQ
jgi:NAD dependent epimerase/dehydratase family enzyme